MSLTSTKPSTTTWTIRLKHHKTTVLLHIQPLMALSKLKEELLAVLNEVTPGEINGISLPAKASEIELAKPVDPLDLQLGWESLDPMDDLDGLSDDDAGAGGKGNYLESENLKAYGLKDNAVLAFRFKSGKSKGWDVVQPSFVDEFDVENIGDMGVQKEYKG